MAFKHIVLLKVNIGPLIYNILMTLIKIFILKLPNIPFGISREI